MMKWLKKIDNLTKSNKKLNDTVKDNKLDIGKKGKQIEKLNDSIEDYQKKLSNIKK